MGGTGYSEPNDPASYWMSIAEQAFAAMTHKTSLGGEAIRRITVGRPPWKGNHFIGV